MKNLCFMFLMFYVVLVGCEYQNVTDVLTTDATENVICFDTPRVLNVGFYAYFSPVSYSDDGFSTHLGYEADLLTALESMKGVNISFTREPITEWSDIWQKAAEPEYDLIAGGITILESRTQDAAGNKVITFTRGHIQFRHSLLVRAADAHRLSEYTDLTRDVRVGLLAGTTGEARLLEITGIVDSNGVIVSGTRIETRMGTVVSDGTADYRITAGQTTPSVVGRTYLYPPSNDMPKVIYLGDTAGESELLEALADGSIDAIGRGEIGNRDAAANANGAFVVTALDHSSVEWGGFAVSRQDTELLSCLNQLIDFLTESGQIGYEQWVQNPNIFMERAQKWESRMYVNDHTWSPNIVFTVADKDLVVSEIMKWRDESCVDDPVYTPVYPFRFDNLSDAQSFGRVMLSDYGIQSTIIRGDSNNIYLVCYWDCE